MSNHPLLFLDLDNTIFQSDRKTKENQKDYPAYMTKDGAVGGWMTKKQKLFVDMLIKSGCEIIPTTARTESAYNRVLKHLVPHSIAIHSFGACIEVNGSADLTWQDKMISMLKRHKEEMSYDESIIESAYESLPEHLKGSLKIKRTSYLSAADFSAIILKGEKSQISDFLKAHANGFKCFYIHHNDAEAIFLPHFISKEAAVDYVLKSHFDNGGLENRLILGGGDSFSDLPFMSLCDFSFVPAKAQIYHEK